MRLDSLFKMDLFVYKLLLAPKTLSMRFKHRKALREARRNAELRERPRTETVYICGNGPSLRKVDLNDIECDYIVLNDFYRFEKKNPTNPPKYYFLMDDAFLLKGFEDRWNGIFNPGFETTYVVNGVMKERVEKERSDLDVYYFCPWGHLFEENDRNDYTRITSRTWNVVSGAILFAIYLGYKDIRLLGCDYSVFASNAHFYAVKQAHPPLREMLYKYSYTTHAHYEIAKYAERMGVKVTNMTKETLLDAYEIDESSPY